MAFVVLFTPHTKPKVSWFSQQQSNRFSWFLAAWVGWHSYPLINTLHKKFKRCTVHLWRVHIYNPNWGVSIKGMHSAFSKCASLEFSLKAKNWLALNPCTLQKCAHEINKNASKKLKTCTVHLWRVHRYNLAGVKSMHSPKMRPWI